MAPKPTPKPQPELARRFAPTGPQFWREGKTLMFSFVMGPMSRIGPRPATDEDIATYPDAAAAAEAA